jgi:hypothetical protein
MMRGLFVVLTVIAVLIAQQALGNPAPTRETSSSNTVEYVDTLRPTRPWPRFSEPWRQDQVLDESALRRMNQQQRLGMYGGLPAYYESDAQIYTATHRLNLSERDQLTFNRLNATQQMAYIQSRSAEMQREYARMQEVQAMEAGQQNDGRVQVPFQEVHEQQANSRDRNRHRESGSGRQRRSRRQEQ